MRVAVVGCGAMGAAAGWRLARRGAEVVCFDRHSPPHSFGSSHGESRITRTAYFEGEWYVPLLQETFPMWRELEQSSGTSLLTLTGLLMIGPPDSETVTGSLVAAKKHGLEVSVLGAEELRRRFPGHVVSDSDTAVLDPQAGFLRPEAAIEAMCGDLEIRRNVTVTQVVGTARGVDVVTSGGRDSFEACVIAAGHWVGDLLPWLPVTVERQVIVWLATESRADWLTPSQFPVWIREGVADVDVYGFPTLDGRSVKLGRHHGGEPATPDMVRRRVDDADLDPVRLFATQYLRGVTRHVTRSEVCVYTNTPDHEFVIDLHPEDKRIVVLSACSGHGFKFAPVAGDIAADLVLEGRTSRDISRFAVARFGR